MPNDRAACSNTTVYRREWQAVLVLRLVVTSCVVVVLGCFSGTESGPALESRVVGLEVDLRIGSVTGPEVTQFGRITALAVDYEGSVYVGDGRNYEVRKFDRDGEFLMRFGGRGEGPGEFGNLSGMAVLEDERVAIVDRPQRRISLFDSSSGEYRGQWVIGNQWLTWTRHLVLRRSRGGAYLGLAPLMPLGGEPVTWPRPVFVSVDAHGNLLDTTWVPERYVQQCGTPSSQAVRSGFYEDLRVRYAPKVVWTISPLGELYVGCPRELQFDVIAEGGSVVSSETVPIEPVRISADELAWFLKEIESTQGLAEELARVNLVETDPVRQLLRYDYPDEKAAYKTITVARDGRVWVQLSQPSKESVAPDGSPYWHNEGGGVFEVFERSGTYIGRATLPADVWLDPDLPPGIPAVITNADFWAVTLDSLGAQYVTRFSISWPTRESGD